MNGSCRQLEALTNPTLASCRPRLAARIGRNGPPHLPPLIRLPRFLTSHTSSSRICGLSGAVATLEICKPIEDLNHTQSSAHPHSNLQTYSSLLISLPIDEAFSMAEQLILKGTLEGHVSSFCSSSLLPARDADREFRPRWRRRQAPSQMGAYYGRSEECLRLT